MKKLLLLLLIIPMILLTSCDTPEEVHNREQIQENTVRDLCLSNSWYVIKETDEYTSWDVVVDYTCYTNKLEYCRWECKRTFNDLNDTWWSNTANQTNLADWINKCIDKCFDN